MVVESVAAAEHAAAAIRESGPIDDLFRRIQVGMERGRVEELLGKPVLQVEDLVYYGRPRTKIWESFRFVPYIHIVYSNRVVQSKRTLIICFYPRLSA